MVRPDAPYILKVKRKVVHQRYKNLIDQMYGKEAADELYEKKIVWSMDMKIIMTCALIMVSLSAYIPEGFGSHVSDDSDRMIQVGDIKMGYRIYGSDLFPNCQPKNGDRSKHFFGQPDPMWFDLGFYLPPVA
ncbi:MAG: hypothetical protein QMD32_06705 [Smithellaceae bacterium]|nr:hypothetical protein [Smithellaceae bacterium]